MLRYQSFQKLLATQQKSSLTSSSASSLLSTTATHIKNTSNTDKTTNNIKYSILGGLVITLSGGIKYINDHVGGTEGLERTVSFYSLAVPAYVKYRYHVTLQSPDEIWNELDKETSKKGLKKILELGGFYVKSGQMCAANIGNGKDNQSLCFSNV